jgi:tRNA A-37 threonylcarbamoyl transferase component Bud32
MTFSKTKPVHRINRNAIKHPLRWVGLKLAGVAEKHPRLAKVAKWTAPVLTALAAGLTYDLGTCAPVLSDLAFYTGAGFAGGAAADGLVVLGTGRASAQKKLQLLEGLGVENVRKENAILREKNEELRQQRKDLLRAMQQQQMIQEEDIDFARERIDLKTNYKVRKLLGEGGYGKVLLVYESGLDRHVVIKTLKKDFINDPEIVARFVREARFIASFKHGNIATIHRVGIIENDDPFFEIKGGTPCFVMEYVDGEDLGLYRNRKGGRLSPKEVEPIMISILEALKYIHLKGTVHRDIKPENVMRTKNGEIKLIDFGIAKGGRGEKSLTKNGRIFGTPQYMSPEQINGIREEIDYRSDIYAVGVMLFEMLEGRLPFGDCGGPEKELLAYMTRVITTPIQDVVAAAQYVPEYLKEFIIGTMEQDPNLRWVEHDDLIEYLKNKGVGFEPTAVGLNPLLSGVDHE